MIGAYLVTPGSKDFMLFMATPDGIIAPQGMVLQVLENLFGLPSSGRNFNKAVDSIVLTSLDIRTLLIIPSSSASGSFRCQ